jgi:hypothetical protein
MFLCFVLGTMARTICSMDIEFTKTVSKSQKKNVWQYGTDDKTETKKIKFNEKKN